MDTPNAKTFRAIIYSAIYYAMFNLNGIICCILVEMKINFMRFWVFFYTNVTVSNPVHSITK